MSGALDSESGKSLAARRGFPCALFLWLLCVVRVFVVVVFTVALFNVLSLPPTPLHSVPFFSLSGIRRRASHMLGSPLAQNSILSSYSINQSLHTVPSLCLYFKFLKMLIYVHVCESHMFVCRCPWRPKEDDRELDFM